MPPPLIVLPGALGAIEGSVAAAKRLAETRPVTKIDYRPDDNLAGLFERISDAAGGAVVDLLGQSYGGWIAQCFARHRPEQVRRLVLSHSFVLKPSDSKYFRLAGPLFQWFPRPLLRFLVLQRVARALAPVKAALPDLYRRQLRSVRKELNTERLIDIFRAQQSCLLESAIAALPFKADKAVLIIESDNDPLLRASARAALRAAFPAARVHVFKDAGHVSAIVAADEYVEQVRRFLDEPEGTLP